MKKKSFLIILNILGICYSIGYAQGLQFYDDVRISDNNGSSFRSSLLASPYFKPDLFPDLSVKKNSSSPLVLTSYSIFLKSNNEFVNVSNTYYAHKNISAHLPMPDSKIKLTIGENMEFYVPEYLSPVSATNNKIELSEAYSLNGIEAVQFKNELYFKDGLIDSTSRYTNQDDKRFNFKKMYYSSKDDESIVITHEEDGDYYKSLISDDLIRSSQKFIDSAFYYNSKLTKSIIYSVNNLNRAREQSLYYYLNIDTVNTTKLKIYGSTPISDSLLADRMANEKEVFRTAPNFYEKSIYMKDLANNINNFILYSRETVQLLSEKLTQVSFQSTELFESEGNQKQLWYYTNSSIDSVLYYVYQDGFKLARSDHYFNKYEILEDSIVTYTYTIHGDRVLYQYNIGNYSNVYPINLPNVFPLLTTNRFEIPSELNNLNLLQNYPNPFNPTTIINYSIKQHGHVKLELYDSIGRLIQTLVNTKHSPGTYTIQFNASSLSLSSGIYFYRLVSGDQIISKSMTLIK